MGIKQNNTTQKSMKKIIAGIFTALFGLAFSMQAQTEVLRITLSDGTVQEFDVAGIKEMTFETAEEESPAEKYAGVYSGTQTMTVGGQYSYDSDITCTLTANADGTLTVSTPEYSIAGTLMGDLTLGAMTVEGLVYDESKKAFYLNYGGTGKVLHFKAVRGGAVVFDSDYPLNDPTEMTVTLEGGKLRIENPFKLGQMPFSLSASFTGSK